MTKITATLTRVQKVTELAITSDVLEHEWAYAQTKHFNY